jgi:hypothetical protein
MLVTILDSSSANISTNTEVNALQETNTETLDFRFHDGDCEKCTVMCVVKPRSFRIADISEKNNASIFRAGK